MSSVLTLKLFAVVAQECLLAAATILKEFSFDVTWGKIPSRKNASQHKQNMAQGSHLLYCHFLGHTVKKSLPITPMIKCGISSICYLTISSEDYTLI